MDDNLGFDAPKARPTKGRRAATREDNNNMLLCKKRL